MKIYIILPLFVCIMKAGSAQVHMQTGAAQADIPLHNYSNEADMLNLTTKLHYTNGNGLKVRELASNVGTGWALQCGGSISRNQRGEPDDQKAPPVPSYWGTYVNDYYPDGYLYSTVNPSTGVDNGGAYTPQLPCKTLFKPKPEYLSDTEQDLFDFEFNGISGQFVIGKNGIVKQTSKAPLKIDVVYLDMTSTNIRTRISQFTITDDRGVQYIFKDLQLEQVIKFMNFEVLSSGGGLQRSGVISPSPDCMSQFQDPGDYTVYKGTPVNGYIVSKWFLSEIKRPGSTKKIQFVYDDYSLDYIADFSLSKIEMENNESIAMTLQRRICTTKRLMEVQFCDEEALQFIYSTDQRKDLNNDLALIKILFKKKNELVGGWQFDYGYFVAGSIKGFTETIPSDLTSFARLCLQQLRQVGTNGKLNSPYTFSYYNDATYYRTGVPERLSLFQDHWGYSNMKNALLPVNGFVVDVQLGQPEPSNAMTAYYRKSLLNSFLDPSSAFRNIFLNEAANGCLQTITYPLGGSLTLEYESNNLHTASGDQLTGGVRIKKTVLFDGESTQNNIVKEYKYITETGASSGWGLESLTFTRPIEIDFSKCVDLSFIGLYVRVAYSAVSMQPTASVTNEIIKIITDIFAPSNRHFSGTITSSTPNELPNALPHQYSRIEIKEYNAENYSGKTVYELTDPNFQALLVPTITAPFSYEQRWLPSLYGLPQIITAYDAQGNKLKKIVNEYTKSITSTAGDNNYLSLKWEAAAMKYGCDFEPNEPGQDRLLQKTYPFIEGHATIASTKEYTFVNNTEHLTGEQYFEYNEDLYLSSRKTINSKGEEIIVKNYYPKDYTTNTFLTNLVSDNIIGAIISSESYLKKNGQLLLTGGQSTEFMRLPGEAIKPSKIYIFESAVPVLNSSLPPFSPSNIVRDAAYFPKKAEYDYDTYGHSQQVFEMKKIAKSSIYSAYHEVIASATNANARNIAYTSFEKGSNGNWSFNEDHISFFPLTGQRSFSFPADIHSKVEADINSPGTESYIVSFWSLGTSPYLYYKKGATTSGPLTPVTSSFNAATGWTYFQYEVAAPDHITISNSNNNGSTSQAYIIDELRLYPSNCAMTTYTYSDAGMKTSECDINHHLSFYTYDTFNRLSSVFDENKNLKTRYEYNTKK